MDIRHKQPNFLISYILGGLSDAEREPFEESYFADDELFTELLETENKLITDYLHGRLGHREKELFERNYLAMGCGRRKLEMAYLLDRSETAKAFLNDNRTGKELPAPHPSRMQRILTAIGAFKPAIWIPAMASLLIAATIGGIYLKNSRQGTAHAPSTEITHSSPPPTLDKPPGEIIERVELEPADIVRSATRSARLGSNPSDATLRTGPATKFVELKLLLTGPGYPKYQGEVLTRPDKTKVASEDALPRETDKTETFVRWKIEAPVLPAGDYSVELRGVKPGNEVGGTSSYELKVRGR